MTEPEVTVDEALRRAFWTVKVPSMFVLLVPLLTYIVLAKLKYLPRIGYAGMKWFVPIFLLALVGSWLVWSIQVPRWRLWAYRRVMDISLLKEHAIQKQIIWNDESIFTRTEIMSSQVRDELGQLEGASAHDA